MSKFFGFTLLEMLVTLFVIGLIAGWAVLSIHTASPFEIESKKLVALLKLLKEESIVQHRNVGVSFENNSYKFWKFQSKQWQPIESKDVFYQRNLSINGQWQLQIDNQLIELKENIKKPHLIFWSSGEMPAFQIRFSNDEKKGFFIEGRPNGEICLNGCTVLP